MIQFKLVFISFITAVTGVKKMKKRKILYLLLTAVMLCGCSKQSESITTFPSGVPLSDKPQVKPPETIAETTAETAAPETEPENIEKGTAVIAFGGDTTQSDVFGEATSWRSMKYPFEDVADIFGGADIAFVNLETCVSDRGESEKSEGFGFRTSPEYLQAYTEAGIDIVSCANNHTRDYGMDALSDTFTNLTQYEIDYIGAGNNLSEAQKLEIYEVNGIKIGFTALNMINMNPTWYATEERAGINCVDFADCEDYLDLIAEYDKQCDVLFVSAHWGIEYTNAITEEQEQMAHLLCDNGADIILGHHSHVLQPIESYNGSMIFYSLGNFLFYKMDDYAGMTGIFEIEIDENGFKSGKLSPVFITNCKSVLLDPENEMYGEIIELTRSISEPYNVKITENGGIEPVE